MAKLTLFHTGFQIIEKPDLTIGRKNADFGQGFYLSGQEAFARRWARPRQGSHTYLNRYELDTDGLKIRQFSRDAEWFDYFVANRALKPDALKEYDVIIGPIANDTIFDTFGILTSGFVKKDQALRLLTIGPCYEQIVIKTEKANAQLRFLGAEELDPAELASYKDLLHEEEIQFQEAFASLFETLNEDT